MTIASDPSVKTPQIVTGSRPVLLPRGDGRRRRHPPGEQGRLDGGRSARADLSARGAHPSASSPWPSAGRRSASRPRGSTPQHPGSGEEALVGPYFILRNLRLLQEALLDIATHGRPRIPGAVRTRPDGQVDGAGLPLDLYDRVFYPGVTADVWMEPGVTAESLPATQAVAYHAPVRQGRVALVLGGRQRLLDRADGRALQAVRRGPGGGLQDPPGQRLPGAAHRGGASSRSSSAASCGVVYGGAEEGAYLCEHPRRGRDPHHRLGQDLRRHRLRRRRGGRGGARRADEPRARQALHRRARQRQPGDRRARPAGATPTSPTRPRTSPPC